MVKEEICDLGIKNIKMKTAMGKAFNQVTYRHKRYHLQEKLLVAWFCFSSLPSAFNNTCSTTCLMLAAC